MRCELGLIIEWEKCDTGDIALETVEDVLEYVQATVNSNAHFDHLSMSVTNAAVKELGEYE